MNLTIRLSRQRICCCCGIATGSLLLMLRVDYLGLTGLLWRVWVELCL